MLVGYGMYYNATLAGADSGAAASRRPSDEDVLALLQGLVRHGR